MARDEAALIDLDELEDGTFLEDLALTTSNTVHDKSQFECTFSFDLKARADEQRRRYDIDFYFFLPTAMGVQPDSYSRDQFYADLTSYLRVRTPRAGVAATPGGELVHLPAALAYFEIHLAPQRRQALAHAVIHEVRLFGCHVNARLKDLMAVGLSWREGTPEAAAAELRRRLLHLSELIEGFRSRYLRKVTHDPVMMEPEVKRAFLLVDEYLSYRVDATIIHLRERLAACHAPPDLLAWLDVVLKHEHGHRRAARLVTLEAGPDQPKRLESYYYRLGLLKKYVNEVLFIQVQHMRRDRFYRNVIAGFCAGLAAFWATLADIPRMQLMGSADNMMRLAAVVVVGVVAYIFKDRIKELTREYFSERLKAHLPDYHNRMTYDHVDSDGRPVQMDLGTSREFMHYLAREGLPADIRYVRDLENRSELDPERNEIILHYNKSLMFRVDPAEARVRHVKNILRFDVSDFLDKLDNPKKPLTYFDPQHGVKHVDAPKVYHINVVLRYAMADVAAGRQSTTHVEYERFRVVLNKKGIRRIDTVVRRGELRYDEEADARR